MRDLINIIENSTFDSWFGNSRVVDQNGKPLVVYHGTNQTFDTFSKKRGGMSTGDNAGATKGFFFTSDPDEAHEYALNAGRRVVSNVSAFEKEQERLRKAQERLELIAQRTGAKKDWDAFYRAYEAWETFEIDATREDETVNTQVVAAHLSMQNPLEVDFNNGSRSEHGNIDDVISMALKNGNDGVIMRNISDRPKLMDVGISDHYVVFRSNQIRRVS